MSDPHLVDKLLELIDAGMTDSAIALLQQAPDLAGATLNPGSTMPPPHSQVIHAAASARQGLAVLRYLLDHGIDPNTRGSERQTALHDAAWVNNAPAIDLLLDRGADIEAVDIDGYTPLDKTYRGSKAAFALLLRRGASPGLFAAVAHDRLDIVEQLVAEQSPELLRSRIPDERLLFSFAEGCADYAKVIELLGRAGIGQ